MTGGYQIRTLTRAELETAVEWAEAEGWNPGPHDADAFYAADPDGFWGGFLDGELVASISTVRYGTDYGFVGFYIVRPEFRGRGLGLKLWRVALDWLSGRVIGLDGVVDQQANYAKSGFALEFKSFRCQAEGGGEVPPGLNDLSRVPFEDILAYDSGCFPAPRESFLRAWLNMDGVIGLGPTDGRRLTGYGVLRPCREGYKIGPLFADSPDLAEKLFLGLKGSAEEGSPVFLDVPQNNPAAVALAEKYGLATVFETARMYAGGSPAWPTERVFGITTFELG